jgi:hypothetical protein
MEKNNTGIMNKIETSKYYQAAEEGFWRIWKNKAIWFWGLFVGTGTGYSFFESEKEGSDYNYTQGSFGDFIGLYWRWIVLAIAVLIILSIIFWLISAVARAGVVMEMNDKQKNNRHKLEFEKTWLVGKKFFGKVFMLDLFFIVLVLMALTLVSIAFIPLIIVENLIFFWIFTVLVVILFILFMFVLAILKPLALVFTVLSKITPKESFIKSWKVVKNNFMEFLKLILTYIVINFLGGLIFIVVSVLTGLLAFYFYNYSLQDGNDLLLFGSLGGIWIVAVFIFLLTARAFISLWKIDILVWWMKILKVEKSKKIKKAKESKVPKKAKVSKKGKAATKKKA